MLAAALESGIVPSDSISGSAPCRIPNPGGTEDPAEIDNFGESRGGSGNITTQTSRSSNCAFARLGQVVGLDRVVDMARRMGISTLIEPVPSMPIGSEEVLPIEMAAAYASLGNDGIHNEPYYVDRIEDAEGNVVYEHQPNGTRAVTRQTARLATDVLIANVQGGTGTRARVSSQPTAGKTGTAQFSHDAWFVGYTPQYATAVWMGATAGQVPMYNVGGINVTGGSYPARIFGQYMNAVLEDSERGEFPDPGPTRRGRELRPPYEERGTRPSGSGSRGGGGGGGTTGTTTPTTVADGSTPTTAAPAPPSTAPPVTVLPDVGD